MTAARTAIGTALPRREDARLLRGEGQFASDVQPDDVLHVSFVRSTLPHANIEECDIEEALSFEGVEAIYTGKDVTHIGDLSISPLMDIEGTPTYPILAETVAAVGQPIAAVLATTAQLAADAAECVFVDLEERDEPSSQDEHAVQVSASWQSGDVDAAFAQAAFVVDASVQHPRLAPSPLEPRAITSLFDAATDSVTVWLATQTPHRARIELAKMLCVCETRIRVVAQDVGGAFGMKAALYPEDVLVVWASLNLRRSVKWVASRSEDFLSATHGRGCRSEGQLAVSSDGRFLGVKATMTLPLGHWLPTSAVIPAWNAGRIIPGGYDVQNVQTVSTATRTNTCPVGIYRGAGRPEANCLMERLVDEAANAAGLDPAAIRLANLIEPEAFPYTLASGYELDSGRYALALERLLESADYEGMKKRRSERRADGKLAGIGLGFYIEPCGIGWESARVTVNADGTVTAATGGSSQGHGRETAIAQIVADSLKGSLDVSIDQIEVLHSDTRTCPVGIGALASRSTAIGGSAIAEACAALVTRIERGERENGALTEQVNYTNKGEAWGYGCYLIELSIAQDTGEITLETACCVDDIGTVINPLLVDGQVVGGFAQGIGEALLEELRYDEHQQLLTGSLTDYALPRADNIPHLSILKLATPSPNNTLGAKGVGEAGTIGAPAAILNAALDALRPLGVSALDMPLTSYRVWHAIQHAARSR